MKCGVCGKPVTGERNYCEVCGAAVLPAPLLSEADIEQYRQTCAIRKAEWEQVLRLRAEAEKLGHEVEDKKAVSERLEKEHADWEQKIKQAQLGLDTGFSSKLFGSVEYKEALAWKLGISKADDELRMDEEEI
jgi:hypothetical protein